MKQPAKYYNKKAIGTIKENKLKEWKAVVQLRLADIYEGEELEAFLEIAELLKKTWYVTAFATLKAQNHSDASYSIMIALIKQFAYNGEHFINLLKEREENESGRYQESTGD